MQAMRLSSASAFHSPEATVPADMTHMDQMQVGIRYGEVSHDSQIYDEDGVLEVCIYIYVQLYTHLLKQKKNIYI